MIHPRACGFKNSILEKCLLFSGLGFGDQITPGKVVEHFLLVVQCVVEAVSYTHLDVYKRQGAGAVVTKTIANEIRPNVRPRLHMSKEGLNNIELYSDFSLEEWEHEIAYAKKHGAVVIANILGHTPSEIAYIAHKVERFGADAIELGVSCPHLSLIHI